MTFKYAGLFVGGGRWRVGRYDGSAFVTDALLADSIAVETDYDVTLKLSGNTAELFAGGQLKLSHTFGDALSDGRFGLGSSNASVAFDDVVVRPSAPPAALPFTEDFEDGVGESNLVIAGQWWVNPANRYRTAPLPAEDAISLIQPGGDLPDDFAMQAVIRAKDGGPDFFRNVLLIFDFKSQTDFKFAGGFVGGGQWRMGHVSGSTWFVDQSVNAVINLETDYNAQLRIQGSQAGLLINGQEMVSHTYGSILSDGSVGIGTRRSFAAFDDLLVDVL